MIRLIQRRLIIPRGDTGTFTVPLLATAQTGDVSVFTIFDQRTQKKVFEKIVTINGEALQIEFSHADTVNLPVGNYVWDIKFYKDPIIVDNKLVNGTEIDSYYAAFKLPVCEIRQTGDALLTADDAPTTTIEPNSLNILTAAMETTSQNKASAESAAATVAENLEEVEGLAAQVRENTEITGNAATSATESASAASEALADAISAKDDAVAANTAAQQALTGANTAATNAATSATEANASAAAASNNALAASTSATNAATSASNAAASVTEMEALVRAIPTNVSELENDAGYLTSFTETDPTVPAWAKEPMKPTYTAAEVGALPSDTHIPSTTAELMNDAGYITDSDVPVKDVQVGGISVLNSGVANVELPPDMSAHFPGTNFRVDTGNNNFGTAQYATAEGSGTTASGKQSHAEGGGTTAIGQNSHAEGMNTTASGQMSHAEGFSTEASSQCSHAEGYMTHATNAGSHAEGFGSIADGHSSHAEGGSTASGASSHAEGDNTYATHRAQHVFGAYNVADPSTAPSDERGTYVEIVGNGANGDERSNARTLDWSGNEALAGSITLGKGTADEVTLTAANVKALLALLN